MQCYPCIVLELDNTPILGLLPVECFLQGGTETSYIIMPFPLVLLQIGDYFVRLATRLIICLNLLSLNILLICVSLPKEVLSNSGYIFNPCPPRVQSPNITMRHLLQMILIIIFVSTLYYCSVCSNNFIVSILFTGS